LIDKSTKTQRFPFALRIPSQIARAIEDFFECQAFSSDYIANFLQQRERISEA
jgi:hypothetical protein